MNTGSFNSAFKVWNASTGAIIIGIYDSNHNFGGYGMHSRPDSNRMIMASYIGSYTPAIATFDVATTALDWAIFVTGFAGISMEVYYLNNTHYVFSTNA